MRLVPNGQARSARPVDRQEKHMASPTRATDAVAADRDAPRTDPSRMRRRPQLSDEVASHLRSAIMSGSFL